MGLFVEIFGFVQQSGFFFIGVAAELLLEGFQLVELFLNVQLFPVFAFVELVFFGGCADGIQQLFDEFVLWFS